MLAASLAVMHRRLWSVFSAIRGWTRVGADADRPLAIVRAETRVLI